MSLLGRLGEQIDTTSTNYFGAAEACQTQSSGGKVHGDGVINYAEFARVLTADDVLNMKQTLTAVAKGEKGAGGVGSGGLAFLAGGD